MLILITNPWGSGAARYRKLGRRYRTLGLGTADMASRSQGNYTGRNTPATLSPAFG